MNIMHSHDDDVTPLVTFITPLFQKVEIREGTKDHFCLAKETFLRLAANGYGPFGISQQIDCKTQFLFVKGNLKIDISM